MRRSRSQIVAAVAAALWAGLAAGAGRARAADTFGWAPQDASCVRRGREVARAFGLAGLVELTVQVDDVFSDANRAALAEAERRLSEVRGVRRVVGPAALLDVAVDEEGKPTARAVLSRGADEARARVQRRADALGWFFAPNGRAARFYVDVGGDLAAAWPALAEAIRASGLDLVPEPGSDVATPRALWPDPGARGAWWLPALLAGAWVLFLVLAGFKARPLTGRPSLGGGGGVLLAGMLGAAAPFVGVDVPSVRFTGLAAAAAAATAVVVGFALERLRGPTVGRWNRFRRPPWTMQLLALASVGALALVAPRLRVGTHQWSEAPLLFVDVRADLDEPVVLREVQRFTEALRLEPGVAGAWSAADLFDAVDVEGEPARRIPASADDARRVLAQARLDPAVALELRPDHREGLLVVRFQEGAANIGSRLEVVARVARGARTELRASLAAVDLRDATTPPEALGVGRGLLASDTRERIGRVCAAAGRPLTPGQLVAVDRAARRTATIPWADPNRLAAELADEARALVSGYPVRLRAAEQERLVAALAALPYGDTDADLRRVVVDAYGERLSSAVLDDTTAIWGRRLAAVRWRHTARLDMAAMLEAAELPPEGVLTDQVRGATLEGMGPVVGIPVPVTTPGARRIDLEATGGAANDAALSAAWLAGLPPGLAVVGAWALLLLAVGGLDGLSWLPIALAPGAAAALAAAVVREPLGLWGLAFLGGALAAGGVMAAAFAARRRA